MATNRCITRVAEKRNGRLLYRQCKRMKMKGDYCNQHAPSFKYPLGKP